MYENYYDIAAEEGGKFASDDIDKEVAEKLIPKEFIDYFNLGDWTNLLLSGQELQTQENDEIINLFLKDRGNLFEKPIKGNIENVIVTFEGKPVRIGDLGNLVLDSLEYLLVEYEARMIKVNEKQVIGIKLSGTFAVDNYKTMFQMTDKLVDVTDSHLFTIGKLNFAVVNEMKILYSEMAEEVIARVPKVV